MAGFTNTYEASILDDFTGKAAFTPPTTLYVGVSTATPTDAGASFTEPSAGAYTRFPCTAATWTAATTGDPASTSYGAQITYPQATGGWGTLTHFGLFSVKTPSTGGVFNWGTLTVAKAVQTNDSLSFAANTLFLKLGDPTDTY